MEQMISPSQNNKTPIENLRGGDEPSAKQPFTSPKLTFITPKLTRQGSVEEITEEIGPFLSLDVSP